MTQPNELRDVVRGMTPDDVLSGGFALRHLPEGTILESISDWTACVAYRVATAKWTVTGHGDVVTSEQLTPFSKNWRVVRMGDAETERKRCDELIDAQTEREHDRYTEGYADAQNHAGGWS